MSSASPTRVVVADDILMARAGLATLVALVPHTEVVGEAADLPSLFEQVVTARPDVVIADLRMPPGGHDEGIQAARALQRSHPGLPVIVVSQYCEPGLAARLFADGAAGRGYLLKDRLTEVGQLERAIAVVRDGGTVIDPAIVAGMVVDGRGRADDRRAGLTPREADVLALLARGRSNTAIARSLGITRQSVETYVNRVFGKLGLGDDDDVAPRVAAALLWLEGRAATD